MKLDSNFILGNALQTEDFFSFKRSLQYQNSCETWGLSCHVGVWVRGMQILSQPGKGHLFFTKKKQNKPMSPPSDKHSSFQTWTITCMTQLKTKPHVLLLFVVCSGWFHYSYEIFFSFLFFVSFFFSLFLSLFLLSAFKKDQ